MHSIKLKKAKSLYFTLISAHNFITLQPKTLSAQTPLLSCFNRQFVSKILLMNCELSKMNYQENGF